MNAKITEAVVEILEKLSGKSNPVDIKHDLLKEGRFDKDTVSEAFKLAYEKLFLQEKDQKENRLNSDYRILTQDEINKVGLDNYNYIIQLAKLNEISSNEFELLIDNLTVLPNEIISEESINFILLLSSVDDISQLESGTHLLLVTNSSIN